MFQINEFPNNLRNPRILASKRKSTINYVIDTIVFNGPQIWQDTPQTQETEGSLILFQIENKKNIECTLPLENLSVIHRKSRISVRYLLPRV